MVTLLKREQKKREGRRRGVAKEKEEHREKLKDFKRFELKRDLFLIHGWGDEWNVCWTEPYEQERTMGFNHTFKDWAEEKIINHDECVHYIKLVHDESRVNMKRNRFNAPEVILKKEGVYDKTAYYVNFFQFAELLKDKIKEKRKSPKIDLLCHSMGGLDAAASIAIDPSDDYTDFIEKEPLKGVYNLITVATPHKGSPKASLAKYKIAKWLMRWSNYIAQQGFNMNPKSQFIKRINDKNIRKRLLNRIASLHVFGARSDKVVPDPYYKFNTNDIRKSLIDNKRIPHKPLFQADHSQRRGITQDPRLILEVFEILSS